MRIGTHVGGMGGMVMFVPHPCRTKSSQCCGAWLSLLCNGVGVDFGERWGFPMGSTLKVFMGSRHALAQEEHESHSASRAVPDLL